MNHGESCPRFQLDLSLSRRRFPVSGNTCCTATRIANYFQIFSAHYPECHAGQTLTVILIPDDRCTQRSLTAPLFLCSLYHRYQGRFSISTLFSVLFVIFAAHAFDRVRTRTFSLTFTVIPASAQQLPLLRRAANQLYRRSFNF